MIYALIAVSAAFCLAIGAVVHARRALYLLKCVQAETVATALGNSVLVDGVELPKPDDVRWKSTMAARGDEKIHVLSTGDGRVRVTSVGEIYSGEGIVFSMDVTPATKKYCATVWKEYRSRVARKAIETST